MRTHVLKTWPEPFQAVLDGRKRYEIRRDDRGFAVGDVLTLVEWDPTRRERPYEYKARGETGRDVHVRVTYLTPGGAWGLPAELCVMSIESLSHPSPTAEEGEGE
jgi:hypothetical protein